VGSLTIPLLVVFDRDGREVYRGDAYTIDEVVEAIKGALGGQAARGTPES